jgi:hypothetical protein
LCYKAVETNLVDRAIRVVFRVRFWLVAAFALACEAL